MVFFGWRRRLSNKLRHFRQRPSSKIITVSRSSWTSKAEKTPSWRSLWSAGKIIWIFSLKLKDASRKMTSSLLLQGLCNASWNLRIWGKRKLFKDESLRIRLRGLCMRNQCIYCQQARPVGQQASRVVAPKSWKDAKDQHHGKSKGTPGTMPPRIRSYILRGCHWGGSLQISMIPSAGNCAGSFLTRKGQERRNSF